MHCLKECRRFRQISTVGGGKRQWISVAFWQRVLCSSIKYDSLTNHRERTCHWLASASSISSSLTRTYPLVNPPSSCLSHPMRFSSSWTFSNRQNDNLQKPFSKSKLRATPSTFISSASLFPFSVSPSSYFLQTRFSSGIPHSGSVPIDDPSSSPSNVESSSQKKVIKGKRKVQ